MSPGLAVVRMERISQRRSPEREEASMICNGLSSGALFRTKEDKLQGTYAPVDQLLSSRVAVLYRLRTIAAGTRTTELG